MATTPPRLIAAALAALLVALAPAPSAATPPDRTVALPPLVDEAGLAPLERRGFEAVVRGAVLDALYATATVQDASECGESCRRDLLTAAQAHWLLTTNLVRGREGLVALLALYDAPTGAPVRTETVRAPDLPALRAAVEGAIPRLLADLPADGAPLAPRTTAQVLATRPANVPEPRSRSVGTALLFEFFVPTAGLFYADADALALGELAGFGMGLALIVVSLDDMDQTGLVMGALLIAGARLFGLVAAPIAAARFNERELIRWERRYGQPTVGAWRDDPLSPLAPRATLVQLPAVRF